MNLKIYYNLPVKKMYEKLFLSHSISVGGEKTMSTSNNNNSSMKMRVPGAKQAIDKMKYEIANEFGVKLGPDATSRDNGSVGGEITKRLVQNGLNQVSGSYTNK